MFAHEEEVALSADADRAVRGRGGVERRPNPRADGTHLLPGPQPRHRTPDLAEDAPGRRDDFHGDGGSAVGGRLAARGRPPDPSSPRRLSGVDWREPLPRSARDTRAAPLRRIAASG